MNHEPRSGGRAYWLSALIGAYAGVSLQVILTTWGEPIDPSEIWAIPAIILVYGLLALPFVALGLALFGLPVTRLLRPWAQSWWVGFVAALWGAAAGKILYYAIDHLVFFGFYEFGKVALVDMGIIYGVPTGLAWWLLHRRELTNG